MALTRLEDHRDSRCRHDTRPRLSREHVMQKYQLCVLRTPQGAKCFGFTQNHDQTSTHTTLVSRNYSYEYMTGRIVLSHVHVSTLRRTRSTEKLIFTGLASGGIIALK